MICNSIDIGAFLACDLVDITSITTDVIPIRNITTGRICDYDPTEPTKLAIGDYIFTYDEMNYTFTVI